MALKFLKKRKQVEKTVETKDGILANVQTLIMNIQQADTNKLTFDIYSEGVSALKEANKGISIDQIDDTMYDLQDIMAANTEMGETLAKSSSLLPARFMVDESELNEELNELIAASVDDGESGGGGGNGGDGSETFRVDELMKNLPSVDASLVESGGGGNGEKGVKIKPTTTMI